MNSSVRNKLKKCCFCLIDLNKEMNLTAFKRAHLKERICHFCEKHFRIIKKYEIHINRHKENGTYPCNTCDENFPHLNVKSSKTSDSVVFRKEENRNNGSFKLKEFQMYDCCFCELDFNGETNFNKENGCHFDERQCYICEKHFESVRNYKQHIQISNVKGEYSCKICDKSYAFLKNLTRHKRINSCGELYKCSKCIVSFNFNLNGQSPVRNKVKKRSCSFCTLVFKHETNLIKHEKKHLENRICHICDKELETVKQYRAHINMHKAKNTYPCNMCSKSFTYYSSLRRHRQTTHSGVKPHKCTKCERSFTNLTNFKNHMALYSDKKKLNGCDICKKKFSRSSYLRYHVGCAHSTNTNTTLVSNKKPFVCKCGKKFRENFKLTRHQYGVHTIKREYKCEKCKRSFKRNDHLCQHKKIHEGAKLFECFKCKLRFGYKHNLRRHLLRSHQKIQ